MHDGAFYLTISSLTEVWNGPELASPFGAAPSELLFKGSGEGGEQYLQNWTLFRWLLYFFHTVYYRHGLFLFPVLYICLVAESQRLLVPRVLTFNGLGIPPKRYIKDGDAECLILGFNAIALLVMAGACRIFPVWDCLHWWQQSQDVEKLLFLF